VTGPLAGFLSALLLVAHNSRNGAFRPLPQLCTRQNTPNSLGDHYFSCQRWFHQIIATSATRPQTTEQNSRVHYTNPLSHLLVTVTSLVPSQAGVTLLSRHSNLVSMSLQSTPYEVKPFGRAFRLHQRLGESFRIIFGFPPHIHR